jgi:hypothetical protein
MGSLPRIRPIKIVDTSFFEKYIKRAFDSNFIIVNIPNLGHKAESHRNHLNSKVKSYAIRI